jgi:hypothetical protein
MDVSGSVALFAGALNGSGRAFVANVLKCGMATIYATARDTASLPDSHPNRRNLRGCCNQMSQHDSTSDPLFPSHWLGVTT